MDEYGQLSFDGFYRLGENTPDTGTPLMNEDADTAVTADYGKSMEEVAVISEKMQEKIFDPAYCIREKSVL